MTCPGDAGEQRTVISTQAQHFTAGEWYINVHTQANPDGEIRGQVLPPNEVCYMFKPGSDKIPVTKVSFVTAVVDLGCGVGYYKKMG